MNNQGLLVTKQRQIKFQYKQQNSSYQSLLSLHNQSSQPVYFKIISTFGKLLSYQQQSSKKVQPLKTFIIKFKLKIPNQVLMLVIDQIKRREQRILISFSKKQVSSKIKLFDDQVFKVEIRFDENIPEEDEVINQILIVDCQELCNQAAQLLKKGQVKKALYKYQESFLLYRQHGEGLYGMAECFYLMQSWHEALEAIQAVLIVHDHQNYLWLKLKIMFQIYKDQPDDISMLRGLKRNIQKLTVGTDIKQKKRQMLCYLQKQQQRINSQKGGKLLFQFIQKALNKYKTDNTLRNIYKDQKLYLKQLNEVLKVGKPHEIQQTPEFVLDPITYQIMNQSLIVPSGHSYDQQSLSKYIKGHGNKDLYTRLQLRYEWARPNLALQKYIRSNPHLKNWISYENQISTFK